FQSLATTGSGQNGIPEALKERFLAFQHVLVIVDAKKYCWFEFRISRWGHGSPSKLHFQYLGSRKLFKIAQTNAFAAPGCRSLPAPTAVERTSNLTRAVAI